MNTTSNMPIPVFVVSLPGSIDRRMVIADQLARQDVAFEWEDAVLGRALPTEQLARYRKNQLGNEGRRRALTPGEIGCALSHLSIYRRIVESGSPGAIILEDDAILLKGFADTVRFFQQEHKTVPASTVVILGGMDGLKEKDAVLSSVWGARRVAPDITLHISVDSWFWRTCSYFIDAEAAQNLLDYNGAVRTIADDWNTFLRFRAIRQICFVRPWVTAHPVGDTDQSLIAQERSQTDSSPSDELDRVPMWRRKLRNAKRQLRRWIPPGRLLGR